MKTAILLKHHKHQIQIEAIFGETEDAISEFVRSDSELALSVGNRYTSWIELEEELHQEVNHYLLYTNEMTVEETLETFEMMDPIDLNELGPVKQDLLESAEERFRDQEKIFDRIIFDHADFPFEFIDWDNSDDTPTVLQLFLCSNNWIHKVAVARFGNATEDLYKAVIGNPEIVPEKESSFGRLSSGGSISVKTILNMYEDGLFGIPHFQRGLVWNDDSISSLLLSLHKETPIGSMVFWQPDLDGSTKKIENYGERLPRWSRNDSQYLIIDGQQRIRNLYEAFVGREDESTENHVDCVSVLKTWIEYCLQMEGEKLSEVTESESAIDLKDVWCINLNVLKHNLNTRKQHNRISNSIKNLAIIKDQLRRELFIKVSVFKFDSDVKINKYKSLLNILPLKLLVQDDCMDYIQNNAYDMQGMLLKDLLSIVNLMLSQEVFYSLKKRECFSEMVELYNRINSGGMVVQSEEKAFAKAVAHYPKAHERVKSIFDDISGKDSSGRDESLKRKRESRFGFKLYMRVFSMAASYLARYSSGTSSLSFASTRNLEKLNPEHLKDSLPEDYEQLKRTYGYHELAWDLTRHSTVNVRRILSDVLYCNDLRYLPDSSSLYPVFLLYIMYPGLGAWNGDKIYAENLLLVPLSPNAQDAFDRVIGRVILGLILGRNDPMKLMLEMKENFAGAAETIRNIIGKIDLNNVEKAIKKSVMNANSVNSRIVNLFYWLLRKNGASDFLYNEQPIDEDKRPFDKEVLIGEEEVEGKKVTYEKQHIIPFSILLKVYSSEIKRSKSHDVNGIGNITYISANLNSFDGISDSFLNFDKDKEEDNLIKHCLLDENKNILYNYNKARDYIDKGRYDESKKYIDKFMSGRKTEVEKSFAKWYAELCQQDLPKYEDVEPLLPEQAVCLKNLYNLSVPELIRTELKKDKTISETTIKGIMGLIKEWKKVKKPGSKPSVLKQPLEFKKDDKKVIINMISGDLKLEINGSTKSIDDPGLLQWLQECIRL